MRVLKSVDQSECNVCGKHRLVLVCDACDESVKDEWGAISPKTLSLELLLGLCLKRVHIWPMVELGEIHLG